jgi:hypothetical protein
VHDLSGTLTLLQLAAVIARARLVLSVDSAAMHLAAMARRPQVALFGPTNPFIGVRATRTHACCWPVARRPIPSARGTPPPRWMRCRQARYWQLSMRCSLGRRHPGSPGSPPAERADVSPMKKISRKELATMSSREVLAAAREPYRRLITYLRPYKSRFALGIFFGLLAGATNGGLVFVTRHVGNEVLSPSAVPHHGTGRLRRA